MYMIIFPQLVEVTSSPLYIIIAQSSVNGGNCYHFETIKFAMKIIK